MGKNDECILCNAYNVPADMHTKIILSQLGNISLKNKKPLVGEPFKGTLNSEEGGIT